MLKDAREDPGGKGAQRRREGAGQGVPRKELRPGSIRRCAGQGGLFNWQERTDFLKDYIVT